MLNKVMLIGRLGRDPELRYTQSGAPICNLRIATDETYTDRDGNRVEKTEWHTIVVFQRIAETCSTFLSKGSLVYVEGSLQTRKWQDQQGQDRYSTEVKAQRVVFLDRKGDATRAQQDGRGGQTRNRDMRGNQAQPNTYDDEDMGPAFPSEAGGMEDIPF